MNYYNYCRCGDGICDMWSITFFDLWRVNLCVVETQKKTYCGDMSFSVVNRLNRLYSNKKLHKVQTSFESTSFLLYESFS